VITGFGRLGAPFAGQAFQVTPDLMTTAKGLTNGSLPMGAVFVSRPVHDAFMEGPVGAIEFFHGYTYSAHPAACAAALATLDVYEREGLLTRAAELWPVWRDAAHALKGARRVIDVRTIGLMAAVELEPRPGAPGRRGIEALERAFRSGLLIRVTADVVALSPPLIVQPDQIDQIFTMLRAVIESLD
jgi:beta-alanine--pyruvate transaminase